MSHDDELTITETVGTLKVGQARLLYAIIVAAVLAATAWTNTTNRLTTLEKRVDDYREFGERLARIESNATNLEKKLDHVIEILDRKP